MGGAAVGVIPVRLESDRLPGKALLAETGTALFLHTARRAQAARSLERVVVATDSHEVAEAAQEAEVEVVLTDGGPRTGSERCALAAREIEADYVVDVQGDWPEVNPDDLDLLVEELRRCGAPAVTLAAPLDGAADSERAANPDVVKVVAAADGRALYFSRAAVPHVRAGRAHPLLRHIGVYGFRRDLLLALPSMPESALEAAEGLEQLRWLERGFETRVVVARGRPWGIESRKDYDAFLARWRRSGTEGA